MFTFKGGAEFEDIDPSGVYQLLNILISTDFFL